MEWRKGACGSIGQTRKRERSSESRRLRFSAMRRAQEAGRRFRAATVWCARRARASASRRTPRPTAGETLSSSAAACMSAGEDACVRVRLPACSSCLRAQAVRPRSDDLCVSHTTWRTHVCVCSGIKGLFVGDRVLVTAKNDSR